MALGRHLRFDPVDVVTAVHPQQLLTRHLVGRTRLVERTRHLGLHVVAADQPGQAWFFIGYPMTFLAHLYRADGDPAAQAGRRLGQTPLPGCAGI